MPVGNWCADLNEIMAHDARVVSCVEEWRGGSEPQEASWCAYYQLPIEWGVCLHACFVLWLTGHG